MTDKAIQYNLITISALIDTSKKQVNASLGEAQEYMKSVKEDSYSEDCEGQNEYKYKFNQAQRRIIDAKLITLNIDIKNILKDIDEVKKYSYNFSSDDVNLF